MIRVMAGVRRAFRLGACSVGASLAIAVGLNEWQARSIEQDRQRASWEREEAARNWRPTAEHFNPDQMLSRQPAISDFRVVSIEQASRQIKNPELVMGVVVNGQARGYPINVMTGPQREIFNDDLGGRPIAATW